MDVLFLGGLGRWGIGGVFRDSNGKVLLQYSKKMSVKSAVHTDGSSFVPYCLNLIHSRS